MARGPKSGNPKGSEYKLSVREQKFVSLYLEYGDAKRAVVEAKFNTTSPASYARKLLAKPKIQAEVREQMELFKNECVASSQEIMAFYTSVMRGEVKDQFGLEATLADRIKANDALAKRQIDAQAIANKAAENEFTIKLMWSRSNNICEPDLPPEEEFDGDIVDPVEEDEENANK